MRTCPSDKGIVEAVFEVRDGQGKGIDPRVDDFNNKNLGLPLLQLVAALPAEKIRFVLNNMVGIEVEAEQALPMKDFFWVVEKDNSLRGDGAYEFKTRYGRRTLGAIQSLKLLCDFAKKNEFSFSERTSIHVHIDVRRFRTQNIRNLLQLYLLFEDALFKYAGEWRAENIFCVPVSKLEVLSFAKFQDIVEYIHNWNKYSALNLAAIPVFGSVEFRHMEGNCDFERISAWIVMLQCLVYSAWKLKESEVVSLIRSLRCDSAFEQAAELIFGPVLSKKLTLDKTKMLEATTQAKLFVCTL